MATNDQKVFSRTAKITKRINLNGSMRRGGTRLWGVETMAKVKAILVTVIKWGGWVVAALQAVVNAM